MAFHFPLRAQSVGSSSNYAERVTEEPHPQTNNKNAQTTVTLVYQTSIVGYYQNVKVLRCKNVLNHSLSIKVNSTQGNFQYSCKIDHKPWHFWSKRGYKSFEVEGSQLHVYWDLRSAKFTSGPEQVSDYYILLVADEEVVLLLGDYKKKAYKRTKSRPTLVEPLLIYKKENVIKDPEMWISVDGVVLVHVKNLQWKFRGNQTALVDKQPVQVMWDVYDWLFSSLGTGHGVFIFKPVMAEAESDREGSSHGGGDSNSGSKYYSTLGVGITSEFSLFLYAWKIE
ncbi:protein transport protein SFT2-like [Hibiscus syriacus]|uniref:Protein transport protein SFT2-like n=1 Tax=Hibiscus syriacus TaxID=106335 RepID=A0A6A2Z056_HIBSY|nr:protein transport protein SFT2-like [Hibiscus syriacus]